MNILALSGSLRAASLNTALLRALARIAPPGVEVHLYDGLGALPLFNPDDEAGDPAPVAALRRAILAADALVIASPEYAHGVSGVMKNALDWMVSSEAFIDLPLALFNASPRASIAQAALRETLLTMSVRLVDGACITLPLIGSGLDVDGIAAQPQMRAALLAALGHLQAAVQTAPAQ
ncbi:NADPH-dependent FMN reductase [Janthinobacterium sp.]|uniref:NADPH-dependent FMN reductase n=1 Tax=Janthinobacterium sp. TaxID=1871054 RepID=UPI00293D57D6|nr:NADPH-dependent FMN reductase [Janthinobacterium sp.]